MIPNWIVCLGNVNYQCGHAVLLQGICTCEKLRYTYLANLPFPKICHTVMGCHERSLVRVSVLLKPSLRCIRRALLGRACDHIKVLGLHIKENISS